MSTTVTVRVDEALREALEERARASGTTLSQVIRDTLREAMEERPLAERIGHLEGIVTIDRSDDPWRERLRERNWRS